MANSVLITGSNRGLGLEIVRQLAGSKPSPKYVFAACRNPSQATELQELASKHTFIYTIYLEIGKEETYKTALEEVEKHVGDSGLDMLINNAGINDVVSLDQVSTEGLMRILEINTVGPLMLTKTFLPLIKKAAAKGDKTSEQAIINVSTELSYLTHPPAMIGCYHYKISKTALNSITVQLADELKPEGITVISFDPGWVQTDMGGPQAEITPHESISGLIKLINKLSTEDTGRFIKYTGKRVEW